MRGEGISSNEFRRQKRVRVHGFNALPDVEPSSLGGRPFDEKPHHQLRRRRHCTAKIQIGSAEEEEEEEEGDEAL